MDTIHNIQNTKEIERKKKKRRRKINKKGVW
jgi:hypothetical protein